MTFTHKVRPEQQGCTLLKNLCTRFRYRTEQEWEQRIQAGEFTVNQTPASADQMVQREDTVAWTLQDYSEDPVPAGSRILQQHEHWTAVYKAPGVPVHKTGRIFYNTLTALLQRSQPERLWIPLHRLDRDTSGLIFFAHDPELSRLQNQHSLIRSKKYLALVQGDSSALPAQCELPLAEKTGDPIRTRMHPVAAGEGRDCLTYFRHLRYEAAGNFSLVEAELATGRKHQIRAHLAALGHPIVQDPIYAGEGQVFLQHHKEPDASRQQCLHSWKAEFCINNHSTEVCCDILPPQFAAFVCD